MAELGTPVVREAALADLAPPGRTGDALSFNSLSLIWGWRWVRSSARPGSVRAASRSPGWAPLASRCRRLPCHAHPGDAANGGDRGRTS